MKDEISFRVLDAVKNYPDTIADTTGRLALIASDCEAIARAVARGFRLFAQSDIY